MSSRIAVCGQQPVSTARIRSAGSTAVAAAGSRRPRWCRCRWSRRPGRSSPASARHSAATSAVLPEPTGPPMPMRSARGPRGSGACGSTSGAGACAVLVGPWSCDRSGRKETHLPGGVVLGADVEQRGAPAPAGRRPGRRRTRPRGAGDRVARRRPGRPAARAPRTGRGRAAAPPRWPGRSPRRTRRRAPPRAGASPAAAATTPERDRLVRTVGRPGADRAAGPHRPAGAQQGPALRPGTRAAARATACGRRAPASSRRRVGPSRRRPRRRTPPRPARRWPAGRAGTPPASARSRDPAGRRPPPRARRSGRARRPGSRPSASSEQACVDGSWHQNRK